MHIKDGYERVPQLQKSGNRTKYIKTSEVKTYTDTGQNKMKRQMEISRQPKLLNLTTVHF